MPSRDFHSDQAIVLEGVRKDVLEVVKNEGDVESAKYGALQV